jgi:diguanylate cyclase (GGDEF)-like protein
VAWQLVNFEAAATHHPHSPGADSGSWLIANPPASVTALVSLERWAEVALAITQGWEQLRQLVSEVGPEGCARARRQAGEALAQASMATQVENRLMKRRQDELMRRVATDALTGVKNRAAFDERLVEELERSQRSNKPLTLLMCDLDGFKMFNDRHGHQAGDLMLRAAASAILGAARRIDIVARYGGEEFAIVAPQCGFDGAAAMAERVRRAVKETSVEWHGQTLGLTVSVGAAVTGGGPLARSGDELIEAADRLLYRAKAAGRDRCIVEPGPVVTPAGASGPVTSAIQHAPAPSDASRASGALESPR